MEDDKSEVEKAEGSRENVNVPEPEEKGVNWGSATRNPMERGAGQVSQPDKPLAGAKETSRHGAGISNRPLEEEQNDADLPPTGERRDE